LSTVNFDILAVPFTMVLPTTVALLFPLVILWCNKCFVDGTTFMIRAPSVFRSDEVDMHKYAAILAATEPFRVQADEAIKGAIGPFRHMLAKMQGKSLMSSALALRSSNDEIDVACEKYETRVESTLRSYGMTAATFNEISSQIQQIPQTKSRIILQAYYYKIAADLQANLLPTMPILPSIAKEESQRHYPSKLSHPDSTPTPQPPMGTTQMGTQMGGQSSFSQAGSEGGKSSGGNAEGGNAPEWSRLSRFCSALHAIEHERLRHREYIKNELKMDYLPPKMSDPEFLPAMSPIIQRASANFPKVAASIISKHQLPVEDFNAMQARVDRDPVFRIRVNREIRRLDLMRKEKTVPL
jgi:hypothetical protein